MLDAKRLTIQDFLDQDDADDVRALAASFNSGAFMNCHCAVFARCAGPGSVRGRTNCAKR